MSYRLQITQEELSKMKIKGSVLEPFKLEIIYIRNQNVSFANIRDWLFKKYQVTTSSENIRTYYKRHYMSVNLDGVTLEDTVIQRHDSDQQLMDYIDTNISTNMPDDDNEYFEEDEDGSDY